VNRLVAAAAVGAVLGSGVLASCGDGSKDGRDEDGPLTRDVGAGTTSTGARKIGQRFTFGVLRLLTTDETPEEPITLERLRVEDADDGLRIVGVRVLTTARETAAYFTTEPGWPPPRRIKGLGNNGPMPELAGYTFRPSTLTRDLGVQVIIGLTPRREGDARLTSVRLDYRQGERRYSEVFETLLVVKDSAPHGPDGKT
jgi:hypothetical protein